MKVVFLGYAVSFSEAENLSGVSIAGNKMQVSVLNGLSENVDIDLNSITIYPVAPFPKDKKIWIKGKELQVSNIVKSYRVPFLNFPVIKQLWQTLSVWHYAKKLVDNSSIVLAFNMFPQVGLPAKWLKNKYHCKIISLLADLPIDDNSNSKNFLRNVLRRSFDRKTEEALKHCDGFITLNKHAVLKYSPNTKYIVMEGGIDSEFVTKPGFDYKNNKRIIYSGALSEYSGVMTLIHSMEYVKDKDVILEIYGAGYLTEEIVTMSNNMTNVRYCGKIPNDMMMKIQREVALLVNPRPSDNSIARVTFPSKIFEYMLSGTPVLTTRLNGLNEDFLNNLLVVDNETPEGFASAIDSFFNLDEDSRIDIARNAYNFVVNEKNWKKQNKRIYDFLIERSLDE